MWNLTLYACGSGVNDEFKCTSGKTPNQIKRTLFWFISENNDSIEDLDLSWNHIRMYGVMAWGDAIYVSISQLFPRYVFHVLNK